jgi:hypothetical protein
MYSDYTILLTACVTPAYEVTRSDPRVRMEDYKQGLAFWLKSPFQKIVLTENSGHSLEPFREIAAQYNKQVELISVEPRKPFHYHYGYEEMRMVDRAFAESALMRESKYFIKATGRLTFPKITRLINNLPDDYLFAVDSRNACVTRPFVTTQLMIFSSTLYRDVLFDRESELSNISGFIENSIHDTLIKFNGKPGAILRWPVNCHPEGRPAFWHNAKRYDSLQQKATQIARGVCRKAFPGWWI